MVSVDSTPDCLATGQAGMKDAGESPPRRDNKCRSTGTYRQFKRTPSRKTRGASEVLIHPTLPEVVLRKRSSTTPSLKILKASIEKVRPRLPAVLNSFSSRMSIENRSSRR